MYIACVVLVTLLLSRGVVPLEDLYREVLLPSIKCTNSLEEEAVSKELLFFSLQMVVAIFGESEASGQSSVSRGSHEEAPGLDFNRFDLLLKISQVVCTSVFNLRPTYSFHTGKISRYLP